MSGIRIMKGPQRQAPIPLNSQCPHLSEVISTKPDEDNHGAAHSPRSRASSAWARCNSQSGSPILSGFQSEERAPCVPEALEFHLKSFLGA